MKIFTNTLLALLLIFSLSTPIFAQENTTATTSYFEISIRRDGQSAWNKAVTYSVFVTPKIDSPKTQIIWDAPTSVEITPRHEEFVDMYKDQTYTFRAKIKPEKAGTYEITVNLIAWQHDTNYTNSVSDIITFDINLVAQPLDPGYTYGNIAKILFILLFSGIAIWGIILGGKRVMISLKKWLTPPI